MRNSRYSITAFEFSRLSSGEYGTPVVAVFSRRPVATSGPTASRATGPGVRVSQRRAVNRGVTRWGSCYPARGKIVSITSGKIQLRFMAISHAWKLLVALTLPKKVGKSMSPSIDTLVGKRKIHRRNWDQHLKQCLSYRFMIVEGWTLFWLGVFGFVTLSLSLLLSFTPFEEIIVG